MIVALAIAVATRPDVDVASRSEQRPALHATHDWSGVAGCESGGDWHANTGNGYYGGLQESEPTFVAYGGSTFAIRPDLATRTEQIVIAERILEVQGIGAWPICGRVLRDAA